MGVNQFTAMSDEEFARMYLDNEIVHGRQVQVAEDYGQDVGDVDWVAFGAVTPVKNQGKCVSSWAFATTGALEGLSKIADDTLRDFS